MEDAFHALLAGDMDTHDRIVGEGLQSAFTRAGCRDAGAGFDGARFTTAPFPAGAGNDLTGKRNSLVENAG